MPEMDRSGEAVNGLLVPSGGELRTPDRSSDTALSFRLRCIPPKTSHHVKRIIKRGKFASLADKPELVAAKESLDTLLLQHQPAQPVAGPVILTFDFTWPWRLSEKKRNRALGRMPHTVRPDLTNVAKTLEDRLVKLRFIEDDGHVIELRLRKFWGDDPGIVVTIRGEKPGAAGPTT